MIGLRTVTAGEAGLHIAGLITRLLPQGAQRRGHGHRPELPAAQAVENALAERVDTGLGERRGVPEQHARSDGQHERLGRSALHPGSADDAHGDYGDEDRDRDDPRLPDGCVIPASGWPRTMKTVNAAHRTTAQNHSLRVNRRLWTYAASGSAKTKVVTSSGCTSSRLPTAKAAAWTTKPAMSVAIPASHTLRLTRRAKKPTPVDSTSESTPWCPVLQYRGQRKEQCSGQSKDDRQYVSHEK